MKNLLENPLIRFILWCYLGFIICFVGTSNVFAAEYNFTYEYYQRYYDNNGTLTQKTASWNDSLQSYVSSSITTTQNSYGAAWLFSSPIPIINNHQYSISFSFVERNNIALSSKNKISIANGVTDTVNAYNNSTYNAETLYSKVTNNSILSFVFKAKTNANYIIVPWSTQTTTSQTYTVTSIIIEDLGTEGLTQNELNSTINNQTSIITNSLNSVEQNIIDNQNQNNQELKDTINDNFNTIIRCGNLLNPTLVSQTINGVTITKNSDNTYTLNGRATQSFDAIWYSGNLNIPKGNYYIGLDKPHSGMNFYYNIGNGVETLSTAPITQNNYQVNFTQDVNMIYLRSYIFVNATFTNEIFKPYISKDNSYCMFGFSETTNKIDETNDKLNDLHNDLTNGNVNSDTGFSFFNNFSDQDHGGLSGIVTAPLVAINQMLNNQCTPLSTTFKGKTISFECGYSFWSRLTGFSTFINLTLGGLLCYRILIKLFKLIDGLKNPDDDRVEVMNL